MLEQQFEFQRLRDTLDRLTTSAIHVVETPRLSPLAFPIWAEFIQSRLTSQGWLERITEMAAELERTAAGHAAPEAAAVDACREPRP